MKDIYIGIYNIQIMIKRNMQTILIEDSTTKMIKNNLFNILTNKMFIYKIMSSKGNKF